MRLFPHALFGFAYAHKYNNSFTTKNHPFKKIKTLTNRQKTPFFKPSFPAGIFIGCSCVRLIIICVALPKDFYHQTFRIVICIHHSLSGDSRLDFRIYTITPLSLYCTDILLVITTTIINNNTSYEKSCYCWSKVLQVPQQTCSFPFLFIIVRFTLYHFFCFLERIG